MISIPCVLVTCDNCSEFRSYELNQLEYGSKGWIDIGLDNELSGDGWKVDGDNHICELCQEGGELE